jgi:hypothetical protein
MFELYYLPDYADAGMIFPRKLIDTFQNENELIDAYKFTNDELEDLIAGNVVRNRFMCDMTMEFLKMIQKEYISESIKNHPDGMKYKEISEVLDCNADNVKKCFLGALKKINNRGKLKRFLYNVQKIRECRSRSSFYDKNQI